MLTRLEIDGFKSFEGLAVDFYPFTVVLGNNAAGKSNLFDAIALLSNLATKDVAEAMKDMRGEPLELFRQTSSGRVEQIHLAAEVLLDTEGKDPWGSTFKLSHTRIRYEVVLERRIIRGVERIQVASEKAEPIRKKDDFWAQHLEPGQSFKRYFKYNRANAKPFLSTENIDGVLTFSIHGDGKAGRNRPASAAEATVLYSVTNAEFPHLFALREEMRHWRLLQLDPALLRKPAPAIAADVLEPDGSNLAAVLARLKLETRTETRPQGVLSDILLSLNNLIPGIDHLDAQLHEAHHEYRLELGLREGAKFSSRVMSDGTLRMLALLTLLHDPQHRGLVCFEEPENGVHPGRIRQLIENLQFMVSDVESDEIEDPPPLLSQLILNSHSPVVLSALKPQAAHCKILFADSVHVTAPDEKERVRRKTRLRPVRAPRDLLEGLNRTDDEMDRALYVSDVEVTKYLDTVGKEG